VDVERLTLAGQLAPDRRPDLAGVEGSGEGEDRVTLLGRGGDDAHLADPGDRHLQGARDRGGAHRQHIDVEPQLLQRLLVFDPEALLLVDDHQTQVLERDLVGQQPVSADDHIDGAVGETGDHLLLLGVGLEPAQGGHRDREAGVAIREGGVVLLDQQRRGHQDGDLLAVHDRLEGCPDGDLGLAVADVAADQPVHRHDPLHIGLDFGDRGQLVRGFDVGEGVLELSLPDRVGGERVTLGGLAGGVQLDQFGGDLANGLAGARLALGPVGAAHLVQRRALPADVAGHQMQLVHRHEQPVTGVTAPAGRVLEDEVLPGGAGDGALHHLDVAADAVLLVHDRITRGEFQRVDLVLPAGRHLAGGLVDLPLPGQVGGGEHRHPDRLGPEPVPQVGDHHAHQAGGRWAGQVIGQRGGDVGAGENLAHPLGQALGVGRQDDPIRPPHGRGNRGEGSLGVASPHLGRRQGERTGDHPDIAGVPGGRAPLRRVRVVGVPGPERGQRPPGLAPGQGMGADVGQRAVGGGAEVDRRPATLGGRRPGRVQELLAGGGELVRAGADPLRVAEQDQGVGRQDVDQQFQPVDEDGGERLHAVHRVPGGDPFEHLRERAGRIGLGERQRRRPRAHLLGDQQFAAR